MDLPQDVLNVIFAIAILVGAIQCFFGYRFFKFILGLTGFLLGGAIAAAVGFAISQQEIVALLAGIVGGFIGASSMVAMYFIGIFLIGAFFGLLTRETVREGIKFFLILSVSMILLSLLVAYVMYPFPMG